jgi:creatinine amidohydrolase
MTDFFSYETLTWPDIAALPRYTPLIIPLGPVIPSEQLADALGQPSRASLLPALPFGWPHSGLVVANSLHENLVTNLLDSLRDDGFSRVYALGPPEVGRNLGPARLSVSSGGPPPARPELPPDSERGKVILIPIGHTEQHGFHLPLATDTLIIEAICAGVVAAAPDLATRLPVMPYGVSTHRASFAGTLNCGGRAFEDFWLGVIDGLVARGFDRFYFLSGHGGNCSFLVNVVKYAGERHPRIFCATAWLYLSGPAGVAALERHRRSPLGGMGHAGELETSLMLYLHPELVTQDRAVDETDFITTPAYYMDWVEGGALVANPPWADDSRTGTYGAGSLASSINGALWLQAAIAEKVDHVQQIHEQQRRRETRRRHGFGLWGRGQASSGGEHDPTPQ